MDQNPVLSTHARGKVSETLALSYLESRGYAFVSRNFRWRGGEIDLIMYDRTGAGTGALVFVEVRSASDRSGYLRYTISPQKRRRLVATADQFRFRSSKWRALPYRFDFIWVEAGTIEHWRNVEMGHGAVRALTRGGRKT